ncbi:hypothetical protein [Tenacibaculum sp. 190524A02b]|uniref:hypothetical protein n=1 Tax=Tenacibaculum vairaonense TaxID=3137860 RepID=UPI0031FB1B8B
MKLYRVTYCNEYAQEFEQLIFVESFPPYKKVLKHINMYNYCGHEMTDEDYKEFVVDLGNYKSFNIEQVEELEFIQIQ